MDEHDPGRAATMAALYSNGATLQAIGDQYGISRERVRQVITKRHGLRRSDGGLHVATERSRRVKSAAKDAASLKKHGCSYARYVELRANQKLMRAFVQHRRNAKARGVGWEIKLWEWWVIWRDSGYWDRRGWGKDSYAMCRIGDLGPYAVGNVYIATNSHNIQESNFLRKKHKMSQKPLDLHTKV